MARKNIRRRRALFAAIMFSAAILVFTSGCKSDSSNPYSSGGGGGGSGPGTNEVWMQNIAFNPSTMTVTAGTTITWTNKDAVAHTVTGSGWGSGTISPGGTFTHAFDSAGTYPYHCTIHPSMTGTITVQ